MRVAVLAAVAILAGCMDSSSAPWTDVASDIWLTHTVGCGSCGFRSSTHEQASTVAVYRDGSAMWYAFGLQSRDGRASFEAGLEPWEEEVLAVKDAQHDGWNAETIHVFSVHTLHVDDWESVAQRLDAQHASLEDPGDPPQNCADCSAQWVEAFDPHIHAALRDNYAPDDPWGDVLDVLRDVRRQVEDQRGS